MFGLSRPVPSAISVRPMKNVGVLGNAIVKWPVAMMQPPTKTALRMPISRSAIQPPGSDARYTAVVYSPYAADAISRDRPSPGCSASTAATIASTRIARMP